MSPLEDCSCAFTNCVDRGTNKVHMLSSLRGAERFSQVEGTRALEILKLWLRTVEKIVTVLSGRKRTSFHIAVYVHEACFQKALQNFHAVTIDRGAKQT